MTQTVVGVFDSVDAAHTAEETLVRRGVDRSAVHINTTDTSYDTTDTTYRDTRDDHGMMSGIRNFFSDLFGGGDTDEVGYYSEAVRRGNVVLAVDVPDDADVEPVRDALESAGAIDIDERVETWRKSGWTGYDPASRPFTAEETARERSTVIPVVEEQLEVGKRQVSKGAVRVISRTVETPVRENVTLREEHATIERHPVDRPATEADFATGDKTIEVEETAERAVVNKSARVVEEVVVNKEVSERTETIEDTVRHTEVDTDRTGTESRDYLTGRTSATGTATTAGMSATSGEYGTSGLSSTPGSYSGSNTFETSMRAYEDYEPFYRQDFQTRYGATGGTFDEYAPAYRYGYTTASDVRYRNRQWDEIEPELRSSWEREHPGSAWDRFKLAVRHGWERVTGDR